MAKVELVYDADCPNVEAARSQLRLALAQAGQARQWGEWERSDPAAPPHVRRYGSPTILVDERDVTGGAPTDANCCRLYHGENGRLQGVPSAETIAAALRQAAAMEVPQGRASGGPRAWFALIPAIGVAMLPKLACPACWPAYTGLLSSVGLGFLIQTTYLLVFGDTIPILVIWEVLVTESFPSCRNPYCVPGMNHVTSYRVFRQYPRRASPPAKQHVGQCCAIVLVDRLLVLLHAIPSASRFIPRSPS